MHVDSSEMQVWIKYGASERVKYAPCAVQKLITFRDTMKTVGPHWESALATWTCPTPANSSDGECDPCGRGWWGE